MTASWGWRGEKKQSGPTAGTGRHGEQLEQGCKGREDKFMEEKHLGYY